MNFSANESALDFFFAAQLANLLGGNTSSLNVKVAVLFTSVNNKTLLKPFIGELRNIKTVEGCSCRFLFKSKQQTVDRIYKLD